MWWRTGDDSTVEFGAEPFDVVGGERGRPSGVFAGLVAVAGDPLEGLRKLGEHVG